MVEGKSSKHESIKKGEEKHEKNTSVPTFKLNRKKEGKGVEDLPTISPSALQGKKREREEMDDNHEDEYPTMSPFRLQGKKGEKEAIEEEEEDYPTASPSRLQGKKRDDDEEKEDNNNDADKRPILRPSKSRKKKAYKKDDHNREKHSKSSKDGKSTDDDNEEDNEYDNGKGKSDKKSKKDKNGEENDGDDEDNGDDDHGEDDNGEDGGEIGDDDNESPDSSGPTNVPNDPASRPSLAPATRPTVSPAATLLPTTPEGIPGPPSSSSSTIEPTRSPAATGETPTKSPIEQPSTSTNTREFELLDFVLTLAYPVNETGKLRDSMESIFYDGLLVDGLEAVVFPVPQPTNQRNVAQGYGFEDGQIQVREDKEVTLEQIHEDQIRLLADVDFVENALRQRMKDPNLMILDLTLSEPVAEDKEDPSLTDAAEDDSDKRRRLLLIAGLCSIACFILCVFVVRRRYQITQQQKSGQVVPEQDPHEWKGPLTIEEEDEDEDEEEEKDEESEQEAPSEPKDDYEPESESEIGYIEEVTEDERWWFGRNIFCIVHYIEEFLVYSNLCKSCSYYELISQ